MDYDPDQIIFYRNVFDMFKSETTNKSYKICKTCKKNCKSKEINDRAKKALKTPLATTSFKIHDPIMSIEYPLEIPW